MTDTPDIDGLLERADSGWPNEGDITAFAALVRTLKDRVERAETQVWVDVEDLQNERDKWKDRAETAEGAAESDRKYAAGLQTLYTIALAEITTLRKALEKIDRESRRGPYRQMQTVAGPIARAALTTPSPAVLRLTELVKAVKRLLTFGSVSTTGGPIGKPQCNVNPDAFRGLSEAYDKYERLRGA